MKTEHTQGPWQRVSDKPFVTAFCKETDRPEIVATIYSHSGEVGEWEANAHLVAASPDLLSALVAMVNRYGDKSAFPTCDASISARAAIAKAKGSK
jgi:hypothetical protein